MARKLKINRSVFSVLRRKPSGQLVRCWNLSHASGFWPTADNAASYCRAVTADGRGGVYVVTQITRSESAPLVTFDAGPEKPQSDTSGLDSLRAENDRLRAAQSAAAAALGYRA